MWLNVEIVEGYNDFYKPLYTAFLQAVDKLKSVQFSQIVRHLWFICLALENEANQNLLEVQTQTHTSCALGGVKVVLMLQGTL